MHVHIISLAFVNSAASLRLLSLRFANLFDSTVIRTLISTEFHKLLLANNSTKRIMICYSRNFLLSRCMVWKQLAVGLETSRRCWTQKFTKLLWSILPGSLLSHLVYCNANGVAVEGSLLRRKSKLISSNLTFQIEILIN